MKNPEDIKAELINDLETKKPPSSVVQAEYRMCKEGKLINKNDDIVKIFREAYEEYMRKTNISY